MVGPIDWDGTVYCIEPGCGQPAIHERLVGMMGETPVVELVCCQHARGDIPHE